MPEEPKHSELLKLAGRVGTSLESGDLETAQNLAIDLVQGIMLARGSRRAAMRAAPESAEERDIKAKATERRRVDNALRSYMGLRPKK
jgi:hypothetical protein